MCMPMSRIKTNTVVEKTVLKSAFAFMRYKMSTASANEAPLPYPKAVLLLHRLSRNRTAKPPGACPVLHGVTDDKL